MNYIFLAISIMLLLILLYIFMNYRENEEKQCPINKVPKIIVNSEDLQKHAEVISAKYSEIKRNGKNKNIMDCLDNSYENILVCHDKIEEYSKTNGDFLLASEWILDNIFLIKKEYKNVKENMPVKYYKKLPILKNGFMKGYPRVYHIALELVSHTDGDINKEVIENFVDAYQKNAILTSGEIWALPLMIKIALIQNISNLCSDIVFAHKEKKKGDDFCENIIKYSNNGETQKLIDELTKKNIEFSYYFEEKLFKCLKDNNIEDEYVKKWINESLEIKETDYYKVINIEHQKESELQISIGNSINSIRKMEALNWKKSFEKLSYVEKILNKDPAGIYVKMDFYSKDYYRHKIEKLSKKYKVPESFVVKRALECSQENEDSDKQYLKHIGYYLIDDGCIELGEKIRPNWKRSNSLCRFFYKNKVSIYLSTITILTLLVIFSFIGASLKADKNIMPWKYVIAFLVLLVPSSEIVISIINWSINRTNNPRVIPKIDLKKGLGEENRTIVIIPTIINSKERGKELIEEIETYYLGNRDKNIYFALLSDFKDSNVEHEKDDDKITECMLKYTKDLNKKYCEKEDRFYYLCRYRQFNEKENKWLAWERKRGKIVEFNSLIKGNKNTSYNIISGDIEPLKKAKYIITLDADTKLPIGTVFKLVGSMSHVLNKPVIDEKRKKVVRGYGLIQPRISIDINSANKTLFSRIFSGEKGLDIYTTAVSDIYQDIFGEGIFTGKGIYEIDAFNYMLKDEIPENSVLSHDLLEGSYVRTGLATDIELIDGYPAFFNSSRKRLHRWTRGDWQLIPWLSKKESINILSKWKMLDNLRRSLLAPSIMFLIILSFNILPDGIDKWIIAAILSLLCPILFNITEFITVPKKGISITGKLCDGKTTLAQVFLILSFLPYDAYLMLDAIFRTIYRVKISRKNLLEWQTAADAERTAGKTLYSYIKTMWISSALSILIFFIAYSKSLNSAILILPFCIIWFISPYIAYVISKEVCYKKEKLSEEDIKILRLIERRTWAYFEDFVNEENNFLAPDNFQEDPYKGIAKRTSPTNMGMGLISNVVAYDLGYITFLDLLKRLRNIIDNMKKLEKCWGHFYNWYNTKNYSPLFPRYISTVDSGNLVGYLWVVSEFLNESVNKPIYFKKYVEGLKDTVILADEEINESLQVDNYYTSLVDEVIEKDEISLNCYKNLLMNMKRKNHIFLKDKPKNCYWNKKLSISIEKYLNELEYILEKDEKEIYNRLFSINIPKKIIPEINEIKKDLDNMAEDMDFSVLFDEERGLFSIGYDIENNKLQNSYYDLLASEARQASFIAIAKGDVDNSHWFNLGRPLALSDKGKTLVSWSGTMFEYFMPFLIMKNFKDTLLDKSYNAVVDSQINYTKHINKPWGISESAFYHFDSSYNYQYKAFGIPGIGVKRGLSEDLVISPYSTILAMQLRKNEAMENVKYLIQENMIGRYGFYEAIDYTKERVKGKSKVIVKNYMVHHQGMSLMAIDNILNNNIFQRRFHNIPRVKCAETMLQEKVPNTAVYKLDHVYSDRDENRVNLRHMITREYDDINTNAPKVNLLSNGEYHLMINNVGSGYSKIKNTYMYRWKEDGTVNESGFFFYIKDIKDNKYFSSFYKPCNEEPEYYKVQFSLDKTKFYRKDNDIITKTEIIVCAEENAEIRKLTIKNESEEDKIFEITSYLEVTLSDKNSDLVHPAFSNLFIQTEFIEDPMCIVAYRRPRKKGEKINYIMASVSTEDEFIGEIQYETDREKFIGRGRDLQNPEAMEKDNKLNDTVGTVLDPIISFRHKVHVSKGKSCTLFYTLAIENSKDEALELAKKYNQISSLDRAFNIARIKSQLFMKYLDIKSSQGNLYEEIASQILYLTPALKKREDYIKNINKHQHELWKFGISGDLPIMLLICGSEEDIDLIRQTIKAYEYLNLKGLGVDLVIINNEDTSYIQPVNGIIKELLNSANRICEDKIGKIFLLSNDNLEEEYVQFLKAISKVVIDSRNGSLISQIIYKDNNDIENIEIDDEITDHNNKKYEDEKTKNNNYKMSMKHDADKVSQKNNGLLNYSVNNLKFFNGYGGFNDTGDEYVILLKDYENTPAPWVNVIANEKFGSIISERGSAYTWYLNSRENKITTWNNDWIRDTQSEALYVKDEQSDEAWSITPDPIRERGEYIINHGFGYSIFKHNHKNIEGELCTFVPKEESVKICRVRLKNNNSENKKISLSYYCHLTMGVIPQNTKQYISTYLNKELEYIYSKNPYSTNFSKCIAFLKIIGGEETSFTGNRREFIGINGNVKKPNGLDHYKLSNKTGAGVDPCFASKTIVNLRAGEEKEIVVILGEQEEISNINNLINKYNDFEKVESELNNVKMYWKNMLSIINVSTPDKTLDFMINGWLLYQTLVCRIWARSGFYQSGGAVGFRDQLQDVLSFTYINPEITKKQILYAASRQYVEGDVQHWWHPVIESGIRTRFSDDLLWLPYLTMNYISDTGDFSILNEEVSYLTDEPLKENEDEKYTISNVSNEKGNIYEHCIKAIKRDLKFGSHGLPLMGSGDWNDGMNTVGNKGTGESVWLAWFLYTILDGFNEICEYVKDYDNLERFSKVKEELKENIEKNAWDGNWYRRAYFDNKVPLGSSENEECKIDSLSQSWAVISGAGNSERIKKSIDAVGKYLVNEEEGIVKLLSPPFDKSDLEPGYIKGYVPGVRENGGQYTHAVTWFIWALIKLNKNNEAYKIYKMINPINHTLTKEECEKYKVEPYVMAADVYAVPPHTGRGGWTWYTGTAGWMYRIAITEILGLKLKGSYGFTIEPSIPDEWNECSIKYNKDKVMYNIIIKRGNKKSIKINGESLNEDIIPFFKEGTYSVEVTIK